MDAPNSYKDPYWVSLADQTERKLGIPSGLLAGIITKGERSNNDQVSEVGAKTVAQIIPSTRNLVLKKYGIDAYLSPENAIEVAGLVLKEGLDRNGGKVDEAVAEYHGGTNRDNWGPRTRAYVGRVVGSLSDGGQSAYQKAKAQTPKPQESKLAGVVAAYKAGKMSPEDAKQFEEDVQSGLVILPRGEMLGESKGPSSILPQGVVDAYLSGAMSPQDKAELDEDIQSGVVDVPDGYGQYFKGSKAKTGTELMERVQPSAQTTQRPDPTLAERAIGAGETALSAITGATGGTIGLTGGIAKGIAQEVMSGDIGSAASANRVEQEAIRGAQALTYAPRTQQGQAQAQALGEAASMIPPVIPMAAELGMVGQMTRPAAQAGAAAVRAAAPAAVQRIQQVAAPIQQAAQRVAAPVAEAVRSVRQGEAFGAGTAGAAEVPQAVTRRETAAQLPVPFEGEAGLTRGQASRDFEQLQFEKESAKTPQGERLRERVGAQREVLEQNFDALVDVVNPEILDTTGIGKAVDRALVNKTNMAKRRISAAYRLADEAGELEAPVEMTPFSESIRGIDDYRDLEGIGSALSTVERAAIRLGALVPDQNGVLQPGQMTLRKAETLRQILNDATDWTDARQSRFMRQIRDGIDASTEPAGGDLYKKARALRRSYAQEFENQSLTKKLLGTKRGTDERNIALEDIYQAVIVKSSVEEMNKLRGSLLKAGPDGKQAWANMKAKAVDDIKEAAKSASQSDERGNPLISPDKLNRKIAAMDQDGRLESLFGKKQAQTIRDLGEIANVIYTAPPGSVNTSNTASALRVALDSFGTFAATGVPAPAVTALREAARYVRDRKTRARIEDALRQPRQQTPSQTGRF